MSTARAYCPSPEIPNKAARADPARPPEEGQFRWRASCVRVCVCMCARARLSRYGRRQLKCSSGRHAHACVRHVSTHPCSSSQRCRTPLLARRCVSLTRPPTPLHTSAPASRARRHPQPVERERPRMCAHVRLASTHADSSWHAPRECHCCRVRMGGAMRIQTCSPSRSTSVFSHVSFHFPGLRVHG